MAKKQNIATETTSPIQERNQFLEMDGLYWESDTHEWFHDKISTRYAQKETYDTTAKGREDSLKVACFVVRNKATGEYDRVMMDIDSNSVIFETKVLEDLCGQIDKMKILKRFK